MSNHNICFHRETRKISVWIPILSRAEMCLRGMCGQLKPRLDCVDAQSDQGLCCSLPESLDT